MIYLELYSNTYEELNGFNFEKNKLDEEDYGLGKPEDREFKVIRYQDGWYYEGEVKKGTEIYHGRGLLIGRRLYEGYFKNG